MSRKFETWDDVQLAKRMADPTTVVGAAIARTGGGTGSSGLTIGTTSTTAKAGDWKPASTDITDATATGRSVLTAASAAAARTAIGAGTSSLALGTTPTTAKAGDYAPAAADLTATGRRNKTTALRGDNTWAPGFPVPEFYNITPDSLRFVRLAMARARAASASRVPVVMLGASVDTGVGGNGVQGSYGALAIRSLWARMGSIPPGTGWVPCADNAVDNRLTGTFPIPPLTQMYRSSTASGQQMTFVSDVVGKTVEVALLGDSGPCTIAIDGANQTVTGTGGAAGTVNKLTYTAQYNALHVVTVTATSATPVKLLAFRVGSTGGGLEFNGWGISGGHSDQIQASGAVGSPGWSLSRLVSGPGVVLIGCDVWFNDGGRATNTATTKAAIGQAIADAQAAGHAVILTFPPAPNTTIAPASEWIGWQTECYNLADQYGVPLLDMTMRWKDWATGNSFGYEFDDVHPTALGYEDYAAALASLLTLGSDAGITHADPAPLPLSLLTGYTAFGGDFYTASYWKDAAGLVHLSGLINGQVGNGAVAVLPPGYRAGKIHVFGLVNGNKTVTRLDVQIGGTLFIADGMTTATWVSLDGVVFKPEE